MKRTLTVAIVTLVTLLSLSTGLLAQTPKTPSITPDQIITALGGAKVDAKNADGTFYFWEEVTEGSVLGLTKQFETWSQNKDNDGKPIRIILNSPGGSVFAAFALM